MFSCDYHMTQISSSLGNQFTAYMRFQATHYLFMPKMFSCEYQMTQISSSFGNHFTPYIRFQATHYLFTSKMFSCEYHMTQIIIILIWQSIHSLHHTFKIPMLLTVSAYGLTGYSAHCYGGFPIMGPSGGVSHMGPSGGFPSLGFPSWWDLRGVTIMLRGVSHYGTFGGFPIMGPSGDFPSWDLGGGFLRWDLQGVPITGPSEIVQGQYFIKLVQ